uniref:Uncharacterized protein n=1 Tax=Nelumbo nucifera TaxID=4432 RepID=A0A822Z5A0_NELNU|nr:TPA_asm: hypothetical protein HUJ06_013193 [Nelumbo nucifera]
MPGGSGLLQRAARVTRPLVKGGGSTVILAQNGGGGNKIAYPTTAAAEVAVGQRFCRGGESKLERDFSRRSSWGFVGEYFRVFGRGEAGLSETLEHILADCGWRKLDFYRDFATSKRKRRIAESSS